MMFIIINLLDARLLNQCFTRLDATSLSAVWQLTSHLL
jgi:hypothetical protein